MSMLPVERSAVVDFPTRRVGLALRRLEDRTVVRIVNAQAESVVAAEKIHELHRVAGSAVVDHAMLTRRREAAAAGDPLLLDDTKLFVDVVKLGSAEVLSDLVDRYRREGRCSR